MEITGTIKKIGETQTFGEKGFRKRELILETSEKYPQPLSIEFIQDACDIVNKYREGQEVKIAINLRGREWINPEGVAKYFNSIQGWRIQKTKANTDKPEIQEESDDLPF